MWIVMRKVENRVRVYIALWHWFLIRHFRCSINFAHNNNTPFVMYSIGVAGACRERTGGELTRRHLYDTQLLALNNCSIIWYGISTENSFLSHFFTFGLRRREGERDRREKKSERWLFIMDFHWRQIQCTKLQTWWIRSSVLGINQIAWRCLGVYHVHGTLESFTQFVFSFFISQFQFFHGFFFLKVGIQSK